MGGSGCSQYLLEKLKQGRFGGRGKIPVLQPVNAQSAIARGALQRGLEGSMVHKRLSRRSYGYLSHKQYAGTMAADVKARKEWDPGHSFWKVGGNLTWYIRRNEVVAQTALVTQLYTRKVPVPSNGFSPRLVFEDFLVSCDLDTPPDYNFQDPSAITTVCYMYSDLSSVPCSSFDVRMGSDGKQYYIIDYDVTMKIVDEVIKFEMLHEGISYGVVTAKFDEQ